MLLVVIEDARDRLHAWIVGQAARRFVPCRTQRFFMPVVDAAHEWRNQPYFRIGAGDGLAKCEQQGQVAKDAVLLQFARRLDAFPGGGDLDQHALAFYSSLLVQGDQPARPGHGGGAVKAQAGIDFRRDAARHDFQNLQAEAHQHCIDDIVQRGGCMRGNCAFQQRRVIGLQHGF